MIAQLFVNSCILVTLMLAANQIFKNSREVSPSSQNTLKIFFGLYGGLASIILMYFSFSLSPNSILDFYHLVEVLAAISGGMLPAMITGVIGAAFRLFYYGMTDASMLSAVSILVICIGCGAISWTRFSYFIKFVSMMVFALIMRSITIFIVDKVNLSLFMSLQTFWIASLLTAAGAYLLIQYIVNTYEKLNRFKVESTHDFLTGLKNTRQFDLAYSHVIERATKEKRRFSMLLIDLDNFKAINDTYGHSTGDAVLKGLGHLLLKIFREEDMVSRIGGDEFTVILHDLTVERTKEIAERLRSSVEAHKFPLPGGAQISCTISVGAAVYPDTLNHLTIDNVKIIADQKLYEAKLTGRNKVCI